MSTVPNRHAAEAESAERAQEKVTAQRDLLAGMSMDDPSRTEQERILGVLIQNAALAKLNEALSPGDQT